MQSRERESGRGERGDGAGAQSRTSTASSGRPAAHPHAHAPGLCAEVDSARSRGCDLSGFSWRARSQVPGQPPGYWRSGFAFQPRPGRREGVEGRGSAAGNPGSKVPLTRWRPHVLAGGFGEGAFLSLGFPICQARVRSVLPAEVGREVNAVPRAPRAPKPGGSLCGTASPGESRGPARRGLSPLSPLPPSSRESAWGEEPLAPPCPVPPTPARRPRCPPRPWLAPGDARRSRSWAGRAAGLVTPEGGRGPRPCRAVRPAPCLARISPPGLSAPDARPGRLPLPSPEGPERPPRRGPTRACTPRKGVGELGERENQRGAWVAPGLRPQDQRGATVISAAPLSENAPSSPQPTVPAVEENVPGPRNPKPTPRPTRRTR